MFDSLWPQGLQHARLPLSFAISWSLLKLMSIKSVMPSNHLILCHPLLLLTSVFPASGSFLKSQLFISGGQSIGASASILPMNIQGWLNESYFFKKGHFYCRMTLSSFLNPQDSIWRKKKRKKQSQEDLKPLPWYLSKGAASSSGMVLYLVSGQRVRHPMVWQ